MSDLIKALLGARNVPPQADDYLDQILTEAAECLQNRAATIEECARVAASYRPLANAKTIAAAIRALKDKP